MNDCWQVVKELKIEPLNSCSGKRQQRPNSVSEAQSMRSSDLTVEIGQPSFVTMVLFALTIRHRLKKSV